MTLGPVVPFSTLIPSPLTSVSPCFPSMGTVMAPLAGASASGSGTSEPVPFAGRSPLTPLVLACMPRFEIPETPSTESFEDRLKTAAQLLDRSIRHLESVASQIPPDVQERHRSRLLDLHERRQHWLHLLNEGLRSAPDRKNVLLDAAMGLERFLHRCTRVAAEIVNEPLDYRPRTRFRDRPRVHGNDTKPEPAAIVPALVNRDVGYGPLTLRDHQIDALHAIKGHLKLSVGATDPALLSGTVVMPAGGGKTRTMAASIAAAVELGIFRTGDKAVVVNHTDQIHKQNKTVVELVGPYFEKKFGRPLKVSEYKAEHKDVSGDVIVLSVPTVNTQEAREKLVNELRTALGGGKLAMAMVDEIHHVELGVGRSQESWKELLATLRSVNPGLYQLGFTATPTGKEGTRVFTLHNRELMQRGVTPRTYYVSVEGVSLDKLKSATGDDFHAGKLSSELNGHPKRNERILESLDAHALRAATPSPSGKKRPEPSLFFGADLAHAAMIVQAYASHFKASSSDLGDRNVRVLGIPKGKIAPKELERALSDYDARLIDGIAVVVSGETQDRERILSSVVDGKIECVASVSALVEGADLWMFTHQIGARPSLSRFLKGQERYRVNRRGPDEVSPDGRIVKDRPKLFFDVVDRFTGAKPLMFYRHFLGVGVTGKFKDGEIFDVVNDRVVGSVDRSVVKPADTLPPPKPKPPREKTDWDPYIERLETILAVRYGGNVDEMALDLGEDVSFVEGLLEGRNWMNLRWFYRRLSTLLYQDRFFLTPQDRKNGETKALEIQDGRYLESFQEALNLLAEDIKKANEGKGNKVSVNEITKKAHEIYIEDLPEDQHPAWRTFQQRLVALKSDVDRKAMALIEAAGVKKQEVVAIDRVKARESVRRAISEMQHMIEATKTDPSAKPIRPDTILMKARELYVADLPDGSPYPTASAFSNLIRGKSIDAECLRLIQETGVEKMEFVRAPQQAVFDAFVAALDSLQERIEAAKAGTGDPVSPTEVCRIALEKYKTAHPTADAPTLRAFQVKLVGSEYQRDKALNALAVSRGIEWLETKEIDTASFERLLDDVIASLTEAVKKDPNEEQLEITYFAVAQEVYDRYLAEKGETETPNISAFYRRLGGERAKEAYVRKWRALQETQRATGKKILVRSAVLVDQVKMLGAFKDAVAALKPEEKLDISVTEIARRAHVVYCKDLPEDQRPSVLSFQSYARADGVDDKSVSDFLNAKGFTVKKRIPVDPKKWNDACATAAAEAEAMLKETDEPGKPYPTFTSFTQRVKDLYDQGLEKAKQPTLPTVRDWLRSDDAKEDLISRLGVRYLLSEKRAKRAFDLVKERVDAGTPLPKTPLDFLDEVSSAYHGGLEEAQTLRPLNVLKLVLGNSSLQAWKSHLRGLGFYTPAPVDPKPDATAAKAPKEPRYDRSEIAETAKFALASLLGEKTGDAKDDGVLLSDVIKKAAQIYDESDADETPSFSVMRRTIVEDEALLKQLMDAGMKRQKQNPFDKDRLLKAFTEVCDALARLDKTDPDYKSPSVAQVVTAAHERYRKGLAKRDVPKLKSFARVCRLGQPGSDARIAALLEREGVKARVFVPIDYPRAAKAYAEAVAALAGRAASYGEVARDAYAIYCKDLPEASWPDAMHFRNLAYGKNADPDVLALLQKSSARKPPRTPVNDAAIQTAAEQAAAAFLGKPAVNMNQFISETMRIYCSALPAGSSHPSRRSFEVRFFGETARTDLVDIAKKIIG